MERQERCCALVQGRVGISARRTVFMAGYGLAHLKGTAFWRGEANVYALGLEEGPDGGGSPLGLEAWRRHWQSPEEGSQRADPVNSGSAMWKLLPHGSGDRRDIEGMQIGDDVEQVAR
jgi:hypothetical protein